MFDLLRRILILSVFLWSSHLWGELRFHPNLTGNQVTLVRDGQQVAIYRGDGSIPHIYPLIGPTGSNVTRHFPFQKKVAGEESDHPHHVSFWMAHGQVNGHDFWHSKGTRIEHRKVVSHDVSPDGQEALLSVSLAWMAGKKEVLQEERTYRFDFSNAQQTIVNTTSVLKAVRRKVVFGDTKEGTFAIRLTPTLRLKGEVAAGKILDSEGRTNAECWGQRSKWVAYQGPDSEGKHLVVALMDHRENLRHPTWWHARDYGLLAANPFGQHDFEHRPREPKLGEFVLEKGKSLTQRYRLILKAGEASAEQLEALWKGW